MTAVRAFDVRSGLVAFLRAARVEQETSQADVADVAGVHRETVGAWEREVKEPGISYLMAWAWALGFDLALVPKRNTRTCGAAGCRRKHWARGMCKPHYDRFRRKGDGLLDVPVGGVPKGRRRIANR